MEFFQKNDGDLLIVKPIGRLDSSNSSDFEKIVDERITAGSKNVLLDMSELAYVSSAGLRAVLIIGKKIRSENGKLLMSGMQSSVREIFEISGFLSIFELFESVEKARLNF